MRGRGFLAYNDLAKVYDKLFNEEQRAKHLLALRLVGARHGAVLDLGCGTGLLGPLLRSELLVGLDPCVPVLRKAKERGYDAVRGVGELLPFRSECFDAVFSFTVIHENPAMAGEATRVSRSLVVVSVLRKVAEEVLPVVLCTLESWGSIEVVDEEGVKDVVVIARRRAGKGGAHQRGDAGPSR